MHRGLGGHAPCSSQLGCAFPAELEKLGEAVGARTEWTAYISWTPNNYVPERSGMFFQISIPYMMVSFNSVDFHSIHRPQGSVPGTKVSI